MSVNVEIVASGYRWVGYGIRSFLSEIKEMLTTARNEVLMTVYIINDMEVVKLIKKSIDRGVFVEIFIYIPDYSGITDVALKILEMKDRYPNLKVTEMSDEVLHAKVIVVDGKKVLVGSANPTRAGFITNYELGLVLESVEIAQKITILLRRIGER